MKQLIILLFLTLTLTACSEDDDGNILIESWQVKKTSEISNSDASYHYTQYCRKYDNGNDKCVEKDFDSSVLTEMNIKNASFYSYEYGEQKVENDTYKYTAGDMSVGNSDEQISFVYNTSNVGMDRLKGSFVEFKSLESAGTHFLKAGNLLKDAGTKSFKERHGVEITYNANGGTTVEDILKIELINNSIVIRECVLQVDDFECTEPNGSDVKNKVNKQKIADIIPKFPTEKDDRLYKTDITFQILKAFNFQDFT